LTDRVDCDVDYEDAADAWIASAVANLAPAAQAPVSASAATTRSDAPSSTAFDKKHPFQAAVIDNIVLTGRGSSKETRHVELSLADSGLTYQPGDALGVVPRNDPALVEATLEKLSLSADAPVTVKQGTTRATSSGCERCSQLLGWVCSLSLISVPSACICATSASFSLSLPSHQWIRAGWVSFATSATHWFNASRLLPMAAPGPAAVVSVTAAFKVLLSAKAKGSGWP
jgi:hypothetical protein